MYLKPGLTMNYDTTEIRTVLFFADDELLQTPTHEGIHSRIERRVEKKAEKKFKKSKFSIKTSSS